jgi:hypothetical protein
MFSFWYRLISNAFDGTELPFGVRQSEDFTVVCQYNQMMRPIQILSF